MGFSVRIETEQGETLQNIYPNMESHGGAAVFNFLTGLLTFRDWNKTSDTQSTASLLHVYQWYLNFESTRLTPLRDVCQPLLDCIWGDGGDSTVYAEDEFEFYRYRLRSSGYQITKDQFIQMIHASEKVWQPIDGVIKAVRFLLDGFQQVPLELLEGFYHPEVTRLDFKVLLANLELLAQRGNQEVRLNFA